MTRLRWLAAALGMVGVVAAHGQTLLRVDEHLQIITANERTTLDRAARELVSTVDIQVFNLGGRILEGPFHLVARTTGANVRVEGALGGTNDPLYQASYLDLSPQLIDNRLAANESLAATLTFRYPRDTVMTYGLEPRSNLKAVGPPVLTVDPFPPTVDENETLVVTLSATDPDGDAVVLKATPSISNATFRSESGTHATGSFTFRPGFDQAGIYALTVTAVDPLGFQTTTQLQVIVNNVNRAPVVDPLPTQTVREGGNLLLSLSARDPDGDDLTVSVTPLPPNTVVASETRTLLFAPDYTQAGVYSLEVVAADASLTSNTQIVEVVVEDVPQGTPGATNALTLVVDEVSSPTLLPRQRITGAVNAASPGQTNPPARAALITGLSPANAGQGDQVEVTLTGQSSGLLATHFSDASRAFFGDAIQVNALTVVSETEAVASITVNPDATTGSRRVLVVTSNETALSLVAFVVDPGSVALTGTLIDSLSSNGIAGAILTIQGTGFTTTTGPGGTFSFSGLPPGDHALIINPPDHEIQVISFSAGAGQTVEVGSIPTPATVFDPTAPASVSVISVLGRGIGKATGGGDLEDIRNAVRDAILLIGGSEFGLYDAYTNQVNPLITGPALLNLEDAALNWYAERLQRGGETVSLAEILFGLSFGKKWSSGSPPTLEEWLQLLQAGVNAAWANPGNPDSYLFLVVFNSAERLLPDPPQLSPETRLNVFQSSILLLSIHSYIADRELSLMLEPKGAFEKIIHLLSSLGDLFAPSAYAQTNEPQDDRRFTRYWRNTFSGDFFEQEDNKAFTAYLDFLVGGASPNGRVSSVPAAIYTGFATIPYILYSGPAADGMANVQRLARLAAQVPEPPRNLNAKVLVDDLGKAQVAVSFTHRPKIREGYIIYSLYRFSTFREPRKLVGTVVLSGRDVGNLRSQDFERLYGQQTLVDQQALPIVKDLAGNPVEAPSATWFYALTVTEVRDAGALVDQDLLEGSLPWWSLPAFGRADGYQTFYDTSRRGMTSDYSDPVVITVNKSGVEVTVQDIEVAADGTTYMSDNTGDPQDLVVTRRPKILVFDPNQATNSRAIFAYTSFKAPGQKGLAIDSKGNLYTDNTSSDALFGGRVFKFDGQTGARSFIGTINYFSRLLYFANPVSGGPMDMGPGANASLSAEDVYVVDELAKQVKRIPVMAYEVGGDPYRRVGQPWADNPYSATAVDLEIENETGNGYLLVDRIASAGLFAEIKVFPSLVLLGQTTTVKVIVHNPSLQSVEQVTVDLPAISGDTDALFLIEDGRTTIPSLGAGQSASNVFRYVGVEGGFARLSTTARGEAGGISISSPVAMSVPIEVSSPLRIEKVEAEPNPVAPDNQTTVSVNLKNLGSSTITGIVTTVSSVLPLLEDQIGQVSAVSSPVPAWFDLSANATATVTTVFQAEEPGFVGFRATAQGTDQNTGDPVVAAPKQSDNLEITFLRVEVAAPAGVKLDETFSATVTVYNISSTEAVSDILPSFAQVGGDGAVQVAPGQSFAPVNLAAGQQHTYVVQFTSTKTPAAELEVTVTGSIAGGDSFSTAKPFEVAIGPTIFGTIYDVSLSMPTNPKDGPLGTEPEEDVPLAEPLIVIAEAPDGTEYVTTNSADGTYTLKLDQPGLYEVKTVHPETQVGHRRQVLVGDDPEEVDIFLPVSLVKSARLIFEDLGLLTLRVTEPELIGAGLSGETTLAPFFQFDYPKARPRSLGFLAQFQAGYDTPIYEGTYRGAGRSVNEWDGLIRLTAANAFFIRRFNEVSFTAYLTARGTALMALTSEYFIKRIMEPISKNISWFVESTVEGGKAPRLEAALKYAGGFKLKSRFYRLAAIMGGFMVSKIDQYANYQGIDKETKSIIFTIYFKFVRFVGALPAQALSGDLLFEAAFQNINNLGTDYLLTDIYIDTMTEPVLLDLLERAESDQIYGDTIDVLTALSFLDIIAHDEMEDANSKIKALHTSTAVLRGIGGMIELHNVAYNGKASWAKLDSLAPDVAKRQNIIRKGSDLLKNVGKVFLATASVAAATETLVLQPARCCISGQMLADGDPGLAGIPSGGTVLSPIEDAIFDGVERIGEQINCLADKVF